MIAVSDVQGALSANVSYKRLQFHHGQMLSTLKLFLQVIEMPWNNLKHYSQQTFEAMSNKVEFFVVRLAKTFKSKNISQPDPSKSFGLWLDMKY